jgi:hypothetical protein
VAANAVAIEESHDHAFLFFGAALPVPLTSRLIREEISFHDTTGTYVGVVAARPAAAVKD